METYSIKVIITKSSSRHVPLNEPVIARVNEKGFVLSAYRISSGSGTLLREADSKRTIYKRID